MTLGLWVLVAVFVGGMLVRFPIAHTMMASGICYLIVTKQDIGLLVDQVLTALQSEAFYVGALGSRINNEKRKSRLLTLGLSEQDVGRLHGPIGLPIRSRTPAEIALSLMAEVVAIKNGALQRDVAERRCA